MILDENQNTSSLIVNEVSKAPLKSPDQSNFIGHGRGVSIAIFIKKNAFDIDRLLSAFFHTNTYSPIEFIIISYIYNSSITETIAKYANKAFIRFIKVNKNKALIGSITLAAKKARYSYLVFISSELNYNYDALPEVLQEFHDSGATALKIRFSYFYSPIDVYRKPVDAILSKDIAISNKNRNLCLEYLIRCFEKDTINNIIILSLKDNLEALTLNSLTAENQKEWDQEIWQKIRSYDAKKHKKSSLHNINHIKRYLYNYGFTNRAVADLKRWYEQDAKPKQKSQAAWELALWHANQYNKKNALQCLELLPEAVRDNKDVSFLRMAAIIEAECYDVLGDIKKGKKTIAMAVSTSSHPELFLAAANLESKVKNRIKWINKVFTLYNLFEIAFKPSKEKRPFDCLVSKKNLNNSSAAIKAQPLVTVIVPAYNAEEGIRTALESIIAQTWTNLEVLVVDDCSIDDTAKIVGSYVKVDSRIHLIKAETNMGPYVARNLGLKQATGQFVTCHDADDWSHPQKIEKQALHLIQNASVIGNTSQLARALPDLKFYRRGNRGHYIQFNMSSLMFRRKPVMEELGYWDCVRFAADSELFKRFKLVFGEKALVHLPTGPLSFPRQSADSLTGSKFFGYHGYMIGARQEYNEAHSFFSSISDSLRYDFPQKSRPFPVPEPMWPLREQKQNGRRHFDIIQVSDYRFPGGTTGSNIEEIKSQKQLGLRTGLIQMPNYYLGARSPEVNPKIRELLEGDKIQMIVYGENVSCDLLILRHPVILQELQELLPNVQAGDLRIIVNQSPKRDYGPKSELVYDIRKCEKHFIQYFGKSGIWYPIGPLIREALVNYHANDLAHISLAGEDWSNIINLEEWRRPAYRPRIRKPKIGRHARDQYVKWPSDSSELLSVYPDSNKYEVCLLGGASVPQKILGYLPENWRIYEFGELHPKEFLSQLDVFVYYTHPDWVESFGRVIIEAMAVGVPVILSYHYQVLFRDAAIYAEPHEVKEKINWIISDYNRYNKQVQRAYCYLKKNFSYQAHAARLEKILNNSDAP